MAGWGGQEPEKSLRDGRNLPRITKENAEWYLIVNEPVHQVSSTVISGQESVSIVEITKEQDRKPFRYDVYRSVNQTAEDSDWEFCDHRIDSQAILAKTHESPRYLYRAVSDKSGGINKPGCFQSEAV